jgi:hypothetical protein
MRGMATSFIVGYALIAADGVLKAACPRYLYPGFYERRGYRRTGETVPFPESNLCNIKVDSLRLSVLIKEIQ